MKRIFLLAALSATFVHCTKNREMKAETPVVKEVVQKPVSLSAEQRRIGLEGAYNTRDLGGLVNLEGKRIKKGLLIRSDDFSQLTPADIEKLSKIPITTFIDFRSKTEIKSATQKIPKTIKNKVQLPIAIGDLNALENALKKGNAQNTINKIYKDLVKDKTVQGQLKEFFKILQAPEKTPTLYTCATGKDKAGLATALVLYSLNVDPQIILTDYMASNLNTKKKYKKEIQKNEKYESITQAQASFLNSAINAIVAEYGSVDKYLTDVLQVDLNKMRSIYLEK